MITLFKKTKSGRNAFRVVKVIFLNIIIQIFKVEIKTKNYENLSIIFTFVVYITKLENQIRGKPENKETTHTLFS